ncbi:MAG: hypothetical protein WCV90_04025 [Candidatus Woesearchaeota archaeon]|jgi:hypothetical protein
MGRIYDLMQYLVYTGTLLYGEHLQSLARAGVRNYDWMQGHLSDFGLSAQFVSLGQIAFGDSKLGKTLSAVAVPTALTIHEFFPLLVPREGCFDLQDIACYYAGAGLAYLTSEFVDSNKSKELIHRLKSRFSREGTIEERI